MTVKSVAHTGVTVVEIADRTDLARFTADAIAEALIVAHLEDGIIVVRSADRDALLAALKRLRLEPRVVAP